MMFMRKKMTALVMSLAMMATLFAGCGDKKEETTTTEATTCLLYTSSCRRQHIRSTQRRSFVRKDIRCLRLNTMRLERQAEAYIVQPCH